MGDSWVSCLTQASSLIWEALGTAFPSVLIGDSSFSFFPLTSFFAFVALVLLEVRFRR